MAVLEMSIYWSTMHNVRLTKSRSVHLNVMAQNHCLLTSLKHHWVRCSIVPFGQTGQIGQWPLWQTVAFKSHLLGHQSRACGSIRFHSVCGKSIKEDDKKKHPFTGNTLIAEYHVTFHTLTIKGIENVSLI